MRQAIGNRSVASDPRLGVNADRLWEVDAFRGAAIVLMVFYHFMWDLSFVGWYGTNMAYGPWQGFARGIGTTFIFVMGLSATLTFSRKRSLAGSQPPAFRWYLRRGALIFGCGLITTAATYVSTPRSFVIFGILHLLGLAPVLLYPFLRLNRWLILLAGLLAIGLGLIIDTIIVEYPWLLWLGVKQAGRRMSDYYPLLPWFGVALLGAFAGSSLYPNGSRRFALPNLSMSSGVRGLQFLGRHSLLIYLIHQPVLLGALLGLRAVL